MPRAAHTPDDLRRKRVRGRRWRRLGSGLAMLVGAGWVASVVSVLTFANRDGTRGGRARTDAIVVLGAAQYVGRPSPVLRARIDHALALWDAGVAPVIIFTGGTGWGDATSEAAVSASYARRHGVPDDAMLLEAEGRTTAASMRVVAEMLRARGGSSAVLVSDPFHMFRLWVLARRFGITALTSPTRTSPIARSMRANAAYIFSESIKAPLAYFFE